MFVKHFWTDLTNVHSIDAIFLVQKYIVNKLPVFSSEPPKATMPDYIVLTVRNWNAIFNIVQQKYRETLHETLLQAYYNPADQESMSKEEEPLYPNQKYDRFQLFMGFFISAFYYIYFILRFIKSAVNIARVVNGQYYVSSNISTNLLLYCAH